MQVVLYPLHISRGAHSVLLDPLGPPLPSTAVHVSAPSPWSHREGAELTTRLLNIFKASFLAKWQEGLSGPAFIL